MPDYQPLIENLTRARAALLDVAEQVPADRWRQRPAPEQWSAAEVIAHLTMVETAIVDGAAKLVAREPEPVPFWKRLHIPVKLAEWRLVKAKTPLPLDSSIVGQKREMLDRFADGRWRTLEFLEKNRHLDLHRWRWPHPFFGRLNGVTWFRMMAHHEIRHTKQLREIIKAFDSPAARRYAGFDAS